MKGGARGRAAALPALAELFRERGFEGASLSDIGERTGLGKGSLYHFFPGGKEEMATSVLDEIASWFEAAVYQPLRESEDPRAAIGAMFRSVADYFRSGLRICLVGAFAIDSVRDRFPGPIRDYFFDWIDALASALARMGHDGPAARALAEEAVAAIQGALILARALDDPGVFSRNIVRIEARLMEG